MSEMSRKRPGPDQARSWAIALAACVINTLLSGIARSSGLLYVALLDNYCYTRQEANLPFAMRNGFRSVCGPLVGMIGQRYGVRNVTLVGGVLATLGVILCAFGSNAVWIALMWGAVHGCGVALGNTLFGVTLNQYFVKYRATASGLALSGACFGSFGFPIVLEYLLNNYGLPGTFLIIGAMTMHVLPAAIILKEPPWLKNKAVNQKIPIPDAVLPVKERKLSVSPLKSSVQGAVTDHPDHGSISENVKVETVKDQNVKYNSSEDTGNENPCYLGSKSDLTKGYVQQCLDGETRHRSVSIGETSITYPSPDDPSQQEIPIYKGIVQLMKDPMFHMISMAFTAFNMVFDPTTSVIVDYIKDKGIDENNGKYFISMMSLGDLAGRLCFGWVTDNDFLSVPKFMLVIYVVQGACVVLLTFYESFNIMLAIMIVYGLAAGAALVLFPILVAKYLPSVQSLAIGCICFVSGILSFSVPPMIGYFRDTVGSYDGMFLIIGGMSIAAGLLWLLEPLFLKLKYRTKHSASICITTK